MNERHCHCLLCDPKWALPPVPLPPSEEDAEWLGKVVKRLMLDSLRLPQEALEVLDDNLWDLYLP